MLIECLELDERVANALEVRCREERWPVQIQRGIPYRTDNENQMVFFTVDYADSFPFNEKLSDTINRVFNINTTQQ